MKQILLFFFLLFSANAFAQQGFVREGDDNYTEMQDSLFAPLNKNIIPFGILYDRVAGFANLAGITDSTPMSTGLIKQAWSELQRADYNLTPSPDTLNYSHLRDLVFSENVAGRIPMLAINTNFAVIDTAAFADGRIVIGRDSH